MTVTNDRPANGDAAGTQSASDFWDSYFGQAAAQTEALLKGTEAALSPAALRREWLEALAHVSDHLLRSPVFLEAMRRNFETMTQLKGTAEDLARDASRATGVPRLADISGLFERMRIGQDAILARLTAIEERLAALEHGERQTSHS